MTAGEVAVESTAGTTLERTRPRRRIRLRYLVAVALAALLVAYGGASVLVYDKLSAVTAVCSGGRADPTSYTVPNVDATPYLLPDPTTTGFPARNDPRVTIAASWYPSPAGLDAPTVILSHGFTGCRLGPGDLLAAGMLHRHGIAILMIDLRNHGDSTKVNMRFAGGVVEYRDVLGAWDWLRAQGVPERRLGLLGFSLGAATTMIAMGQEPRVAAIWADSSYGDIGSALRDELARNSYPAILQAGGVLAGKIIGGVDLESHSPLETTTLLHGRPIFLTHGLLDQRINVRYAYELAASVAAHGEVAGLWIVPGAGHTEAIRLHPAEYEQRLSDFFLGALGAG
jgi:dipeptidyl aminopeptidase/acylaminoacyl peptidase